MRFREFFDRTYIINLPERADRRQQTIRELDRVGLALEPNKVEIFSGIRPTEAAGFTSIGCRGCFLSHVGVLQKAQATGAKNVLIFEDDIAFTPQFLNSEPALIERLQTNDWGIAYFGHAEGPEGPEPATLVPFTKPLLLLHFLAVNGHVFDRLLTFLNLLQTRPAGHPDGGPMYPDGAYSMFRQLNPDVLTLIARPNLGRQRSSKSDIAEPKWFDRVAGVRQLAKTLRQTKVYLFGR